MVRPALIALRLQIARLAFVGVTFDPRGTAEWLARLDCARWVQAIAGWQPLTYLRSWFWNLRRPMFQRKKATRKIHPKLKSSSEQVFQNHVRWVSDSCHREEGKSSRKLIETVRVNAPFSFWHFGILGGFSGLLKMRVTNPIPHKKETSMSTKYLHVTRMWKISGNSEV